MRHHLTRLLDAPALMAAMLVDAAIVGTAPVTRTSFEKVAKGRFDMALWDELMAKAIEAGLIVNGKIMEKDQNKAVMELSK